MIFLQILAVSSLRFSSAISFSLVVVFLVVIGVTIYKLIMGSIETPTWFPRISDLAFFCDLFTAVPVLDFAYVCHYNGKQLTFSLYTYSCFHSVFFVACDLCTLLGCDLYPDCMICYIMYFFLVSTCGNCMI